MASHETAINTSFDYSIKGIVLYTSDGNFIDLRGMMLSLDIYEDIFSASMKGSIEISDGQDILSVFKIHGNEYIEIELEKPTLDIAYKQSFRIYRVSDRSFINGSHHYKMYFCSEEFILSSQMMVSKSYKGMTTGNIISDIMSNILKANPKKLRGGVFERIDNPVDIIIPRMHPIEAIYWLLTRSFGVNNSLHFFYENRDGFNLRSFENLLKSSSYTTYYQSIKTDAEPLNNYNRFTNLIVVEDFDLLKASRFGTFSSHLVNLDIVSKKFVSYAHSAFQEKASGLLNDELAMNNAINRVGGNMYSSFGGMAKYMITNDADTSRNPTSPEQWLMRKASKYGQLQTYKMMGTIPGDPLVKAGMLVNVELPLMNPQEKQNVIMNDNRSGRYLVSAVHHSYKKNVHATVIEMLSDSISGNMNAPSNAPKLKELKEA